VNFVKLILSLYLSRLHELRRGLKRTAEIHSLAFSPCGDFLVRTRLHVDSVRIILFIIFLKKIIFQLLGFLFQYRDCSYIQIERKDKRKVKYYIIKCSFHFSTTF